MRFPVLVCALLCALTSLTASPAHAAEGSSAQPLIIGGSPVTSAPWAAAVYRSGSFTCSGTILSPQWVLTAKHCVGASLSVRVGNVYRAQGTPSSVTRYVSHPQADVSLLQLSTPVQTSQYSRLADANPPIGSTNQLYGWGYTSRNGPVSPQLKTADVRLTSICRDYYGGQALCTSRITGNAWSGDSGGPQVYNGLQVGVASTADGTSTQQYSSVPAVRAWIRSTSGV